MIFLFIVNQYHILLNVFFFCVSTSFSPCTIPCLFTRWKKKLLSGTFLHDHDEDFRFLFV